MLLGSLLMLTKNSQQPEVVTRQTSESAADPAQANAPYQNRPTTLYTALVCNPKWKKESHHCPKSKRTKLMQKCLSSHTPAAEKGKRDSVMSSSAGIWMASPIGCQAHGIPYAEGHGIRDLCMLGIDRFPQPFSKCIEFIDISYQLAQAVTPRDRHLCRKTQQRPLQSPIWMPITLVCSFPLSTKGSTPKQHAGYF